MGAEARGVKWPRIELEKRDAWLNIEQCVEARVTYTHPLLHRSRPTALQKAVHPRITILYSHSCCSKTVWLSFFCGAQKMIFRRMSQWICIYFSSQHNESQWGLMLFWTVWTLNVWESMFLFSKRSHFVFCRTKSFIQVWKDTRVSEWW